MSLALMRERIAASGGTLRGEQVRDGRLALEDGMEDDVSYAPGFVRYGSGDRVPIKVWGQKFSAAYGFTAQFLATRRAPVRLGDLLLDRECGECWLCVESFDVSGVHFEGKLAKCMRLLRWQDADGALKETPAIVTSSSKYNNGEDGTTVVRLGSDQLLLFMQLNADTARLDHGVRFLIDENRESPTAYELTRADTALYSYGGRGFMSVIVTECAYTPTERELELGVCDYRPPRALGKMSGSAGGVSASISGSDTLRVRYRQAYRAVLLDAATGEPVAWEGSGASWELSPGDGVLMEEDGGTAWLSAGEGAAGRTYSLRCLIGGEEAARAELPAVDGW